MSTAKPIKLLLIEADPNHAHALAHQIYKRPEFLLIATADSAAKAMTALASTKPDVILLDTRLNQTDNGPLVDQILEKFPTPVVLCLPPDQQPATPFQLTDSGVIAGVQKPSTPSQPNFDSLCSHLFQTIKLMSQVKVVRHWKTLRPKPPAPLSLPPMPPAPSNRSSVIFKPVEEEPVRFVAIGASTGGPEVLKTIISSLPAKFPVPILIVQHITPGFLDNLLFWVQSGGGPKALVAQSGQIPQPGHVYFAPDNQHMGLTPTGEIFLSDQPPESNVRPSVSFLFRSLALSFAPATVAVILTGMGKDGASELLKLRASGAYTIAQNQETSVVNGMPGEAVRLDAATAVLPSDKIGPAILAQVVSRAKPAK